MEENNSIIQLADRPRPSIAAAAGMVMLAAAGLWVATLAELLIHPGAGLAGELWTDALYYLPFVLLPVIVYCMRREGLSDGLRLNPMRHIIAVFSVMLLGVVCVYAASALDALWVALLNAIGLTEPTVALDTGTNIPVTTQVITSAVIPAVCEELLFRGVVFSAFEKRGTWRAIWVSAALFALLHGNLFGLPAYFLVGVVSAFVVYALDSLYVGMLFHTAYNAAILVFVHLMSGYDSVEAAEAVSPIPLAMNLVLVGMMMATLLMSLEGRRLISGIQPVPRRREPMPWREKLLVAAAVALMLVNTAIVQILTETGL